jgi:hypothetical protein
LELAAFTGGAIGIRLRLNLRAGQKNKGDGENHCRGLRIKAKQEFCFHRRQLFLTRPNAPNQFGVN